MSYIKKLSEDLDTDTYGAKASSLSFLLNNSISVPAGFAINKFALKEYTKDIAFLDKITPLLSSNLKQLKSKYLMVRSSAIGEDSAGNSYAGQLDSFQVHNNVESVVGGIKKCWNSMYNQRLSTYQVLDDIPLTEMAVIVQEMIDPDYAGVLFTSSPRNDDKVYVEYVKGHAEKLVQGEVTPKSIQLDNFKTSHQYCPFNLNLLLNESQKILKAYNLVPQDIEWAYKGNQFYFVQSRPITTLKERIKWSNANVNENYPDKLSPLLYSIAKQSYYHYYKNLALNFSMLKINDFSYEKHFANAIGRWGHKMYYNMTSIHEIISLSPVSQTLKTSFDNFIGYQKENSIHQKISSLFRKIKFANMIIFHNLNLEKYVCSIEDNVERYSNKYLHEKSLSTLTEAFHTFLHIRFQLWVKASFADFFAMLYHGILGKIVFIIEPEKYQGIQNNLIQAIPHLVSNKPLQLIWQIQQQIESNNKFSSLFLKPSPEILTELKESIEYKDLALTINDYLKVWGFRCSGELTFLADNYIDKPESFIEMIKAFSSCKPSDPQELIKLKAKERNELLKLVSKKLSKHYKYNFLKKIIMPFLLKKIVSLTIYSISCRERVRLKQAQMYYTFKQNCLNIGKLLLKAEVLLDAKDIFYLEYTEINRLTSGESIDKEYTQSLILLRKKSLLKAKTNPANFDSFREDLGSKVIEEDKNEYNEPGVLRGIPACGGFVTGQIIILDSVHEIKKIKKGDILVTKQTDPGWICAFPLISGLIVENGGMLSHGAIVAREYGIPAVVGVEGITSKLKDRQKVEINGDSGVIKCLD